MAGEAYRGKVGEHYVLYKLVREGFNATMAPHNTEAVDIYASDPGGAAFAVQVKNKSNSTVWRLNKKSEEIEDARLFYALVDLGRNLDRDPPDVFILPSSEVARVCRVEHKAWLNTPAKSGKPKKSGAMRAIADNYPPHRYGEVEGCPTGWMEKYKEGWEALRNLSTTVVV